MFICKQKSKSISDTESEEKSIDHLHEKLNYKLSDFPIYYQNKHQYKKLFDDKGYMKFSENDSIVNRYEVKNILGKGAFSNVLSCYDHKRLFDVAIKVVRNEKRFFLASVKEIDILKTINDNSNIIKLINYFTCENIRYLVFKNHGRSLYDKFIKAKILIPFNHLKDVLKQILLGLEYVHKNQIIHADLKPENILINENNIIKIIDFGSSLFNEDFKSKNNFYIQSRWYRSPEVIMNIDYDMKIDIWSFGCIAYELCTNKAIFTGKCYNEQISLYYHTLGIFPDIYRDSSLWFKYFNYEGLYCYRKYNPKKIYLNEIYKNDIYLYKLIIESIILSPKNRPTASELLKHKYLN